MKVKSFIYQLFILGIMFFLRGFNIVKAEENQFEYTNQLGYIYSNNQTIFKVYSSSANRIGVKIEGVDETLYLMRPQNSVDNIWIGYQAGDLLGKEYTLIIEDDNNVYENILDPYGKYLNEDGTKNIIYAGEETTFEEWENQKSYLKIRDQDKIIYGVNVENFTSHASWKGSEINRGKLLGLIESTTSSYDSGFDYVKKLGITYLELSPVNDENNPFAISNNLISNGEVYSGELEFKQVINSYYSSGIGVVLTFDYNDFSEQFLNSLKYIDKDSYLNDQLKLDLTKKMVQEYIYELLEYYIKNYKLSGIKIENLTDYPAQFMSHLITDLKKVNDQLLVYGSGAYANANENTVGENNFSAIEGLRMNNGSLSYGLFGNLLNSEEKGVLDSNYSKSIMETLKFALLSSVDNGQIDYSLVKGVSYKNYWGNSSAYQLINHIGQSDGLSIYDKLSMSNFTNDNILKQKIILAYGTMVMSGGIPYIYSGEEFMMSYKDLEKGDNSLCDESNIFCYHTNENKKSIDWTVLNKNIDLSNALKSLINYRKSSNSVAQTNTDVLKNNVDIYVNDNHAGVIGFTRNYPNAHSKDVEKVVAMFNYSNNDYTIEFSGKGWIGLYTYNASIRDGDNLILKGNSIYTEFKEKQPKVNPTITLLLAISIIGLLYYANIMLNKKLVEKNGYDIEKVNKKYRPFIKTVNNDQNKNKNKNSKN